MCNIICQLEPDEGPTTLRTPICEVDFLTDFLSHDHRQPHSSNSDHPSFTLKAASRLFFSIAISKQLYAAPYLGGNRGSLPGPPE